MHPRSQPVKTESLGQNIVQSEICVKNWSIVRAAAVKHAADISGDGIIYAEHGLNISGRRVASLRLDRPGASGCEAPVMIQVQRDLEGHGRGAMFCSRLRKSEIVGRIVKGSVNFIP